MVEKQKTRSNKEGGGTAGTTSARKETREKQNKKKKKEKKEKFMVSRSQSRTDPADSEPNI